MPTLRSGLVIAGRYADKVRRVLFAQLKDKVKNGEIEAKEVARAAGELNRLLFEILVNRLEIDKGDVVRITIDYEITDNFIKWKLDTLTIQVWKRVPDEQVETITKSVVSHAEEILSEQPNYEIVKLGETDTGDIIFKVTYAGADAGAIMLTPINGKAIVRAAFLDPAPKILKKKLFETGELDPQSFVKENLVKFIEDSEDSERSKAERVYREILSLLEVSE